MYLHVVAWHDPNVCVLNIVTKQPTVRVGIGFHRRSNFRGKKPAFQLIPWRQDADDARVGGRSTLRFLNRHGFLKRGLGGRGDGERPCSIFLC